MFGKSMTKIPVKLYTDSKPLLESIASSKQVERKLSWNSINDFKMKDQDGSIDSYNWLDTKDMIADLLTKERKDDKEVLDIVIENVFRKASSNDNGVLFDGQEIKMMNVRNKARNDETDLVSR